jgi:hypothetical protein
MEERRGIEFVCLVGGVPLSLVSLSRTPEALETRNARTADRQAGKMDSCTNKNTQLWRSD